MGIKAPLLPPGDRCEVSGIGGSPLVFSFYTSCLPTFGTPKVISGRVFLPSGHLSPHGLLGLGLILTWGLEASRDPC